MATSWQTGPTCFLTLVEIPWDPEKEELFLRYLFKCERADMLFLIWWSGILGLINHYSLWPLQGRSYSSRRIYSCENIALLTLDLGFLWGKFRVKFRDWTRPCPHPQCLPCKREWVLGSILRTYVRSWEDRDRQIRLALFTEPLPSAACARMIHTHTHTQTHCEHPGFAADSSDSSVTLFCSHGQPCPYR